MKGKTNVFVEELCNWKLSQVTFLSRCFPTSLVVLDVEEVLSKPILPQSGIDIKFKRSKPTVDRSSFLLKTSIEGKQEKITDSRLKLYIAVLVGNSTLLNLIDLSTPTEQVCLAQFNTDLSKKFAKFRKQRNGVSSDFEKIRQQHQLKPQLQNKVISFVEIYQCDTITITYTDARQSMNYDDLQQILAPTEKNVFAFQSFTNQPAKVEFISADGKIIVAHLCGGQWSFAWF